MASTSTTSAGAAAPSKALKRLTKEFNDFRGAAPSSLHVQLIEQSLFHWHIALLGPANTPYDKYWFVVDVVFPDAYPMKPPTVKFITPIYHPNVSMPQGGAVCADIISKDWSPVLRIDAITQRLTDMLVAPHADTPLEADIGEAFVNAPKKFKETAVAWTKKHAATTPPF